MQLVGDVLVITLFVHITGGLDSPMSFLYLLPITVASMVLYRNGAPSESRPTRSGKAFRPG